MFWRPQLPGSLKLAENAVPVTAARKHGAGLRTPVLVHRPDAQGRMAQPFVFGVDAFRVGGALLGNICEL